MCVFVCIHGLVAKEGDLISCIFEEDLSLSTLVQRPYKELSLQKTVRPEEKDEGSYSVRGETSKQSVKTQRNEDDGQMSQHFW